MASEHEMAPTSQNIDAAQAVAAAVAQIELAVREVHPAVEQLGALIDHLAGAWVSCGRAGRARPIPRPSPCFPTSLIGQ